MFDLSFEVWGSLMSWDRTVLRGGMGSSSYKLFYFREGSLVGVLTVGRLGDERKLIPKLVKARLDYHNVADQLADEEFGLSALVE
jgi:L-aminopeptidase/D-esterase-like protein